MKKILVTGAAGFIGFHIAKRLLKKGHTVMGFDAMTDYYDPGLKRSRLQILRSYSGFDFLEEYLETPGRLCELFAVEKFDTVIHLAAQAGVRYSLDEPRSYVSSNIAGTLELLEAARLTPPRHLLMASTSSVYGLNTEMPYSEGHKADAQASLYAATKKANEAMGHSYSHLFGIPTTMFRFFTVYGPWGRPDMALFKFVKAMLEDSPIDIYNHGKMMRDFTFIDDIVDAIEGLIDACPVAECAGKSGHVSSAPFRVVNIGNQEPVKLMDFVLALEVNLGVEAKKNFMDMQPGDVPATWADTTLLRDITGIVPSTTIDDGVASFVDWYRTYYQK